MANGFHGTKEEWERIESPLHEVDPAFTAFARDHGLEVSKNGKWPQRSFRWSDQLERLIELYLDDDQLLGFTLWICATQDRKGARYWKKHTLFTCKRMYEIAPTISVILAEAHALVSSWAASELELAN